MKNIIVVVNQKGGVGKTTTVLNTATALAKNRKKVLVIDLDPQGNATTGCGVDKNQLTNSIYDVLINDLPAKDAVIASVNCGFDIIPSNRNLAGAEIELVSLANREYRLQESLTKIASKYDLVIIDCPPSLSLLTINALTAATYLLVPVQCEYYALEGLSDLLNTVRLISEKLNPTLELLGLVRTMYDGRNNLAQQVSVQLNEHFNDKLFYAYIPRNVRLAEAPSFGYSAVAIDANATGSQAYLSLAKELLARIKNK